MTVENVETTIAATDGFALAATLYRPQKRKNGAVIMINSATAVPRQFYRRYAHFLAEAGYTAVTFDYRGIGGSRPAHLRGFEARVRDWAEKDIAGVIEWIEEHLSPQRLFAVGHSVGGQVMGLLANGRKVDAMVTMSAQSGHWRLQGGNQKLAVAFHVYVTFPALAHLFGYLPWSRLGSAEDLPKGVALEWARWCRHPRYLLGDETLPLARYANFTAPVLAYSIDDDDWGTRAAVDAMMGAYPNVERRHVVPAEVGIKSLGHMGFFRPRATVLWQETLAWLAQQPQPSA